MASTSLDFRICGSSGLRKRLKDPEIPCDSKRVVRGAVVRHLTCFMHQLYGCFFSLGFVFLELGFALDVF